MGRCGVGAKNDQDASRIGTRWDPRRLSARLSAYAADDIDVQLSGKASVVAGVSDGDFGADGDILLKMESSAILDNGVELGTVLEARADGDMPSQLFGGGRYSSILAGGPRGVGPASGDVYLQGASAYVRSSLGRFSIGREGGVAQKLAVTSPTVFQSINVNDWRTDLTGLNDVHTVNDFTGYSTKVTYMPPANFLGGVLGGLQLGVSYAPKLRNCGDRACAPLNGFVVAPDGSILRDTSHWDDAVEFALFYQNRIGGRKDGVSLGLGASYVSADEDVLEPSVGVYGDYEAYALGLNIAYRGITIGGSIKSTNAGLASLEDDGYLAFDAGITFKTGDEPGDWGVMIGVAQSEANAIGPNPVSPDIYQDTQSAQAGVSVVVGRGITIGAAAQYIEAERPLAAGGPEDATTVVIESAIRF